MNLSHSWPFKVQLWQNKSNRLISMCETNSNGKTESVFNVIKLFLSRFSACDTMYNVPAIVKQFKQWWSTIQSITTTKRAITSRQLTEFKKANKYMTFAGVEQEQKCGGDKSITGTQPYHLGLQQQCIYMCEKILGCN